MRQIPLVALMRRQTFVLFPQMSDVHWRLLELKQQTTEVKRNIIAYSCDANRRRLIMQSIRWDRDPCEFHFDSSQLIYNKR